MAGGKLSLDDLDGSDLVSGPADAAKPKRLALDDLDGSEVVSATPAVDAGPDARRAAAGRPRAPSLPPAPAELDPGLDLRDAPMRDTSFFPKATPFAPGSHEQQAAALNAELPSSARVGTDPLQVDWGAQAITSGLLGHGAGTAAGGALRALGVPAVPARIAGAAVEGGVASKTQGGDFTSGAVIGGGLASLGSAVRAAAGGRNIVKDVTKGATKAPARLVNDVKHVADGDRLTTVLGEVPAARRAVTVKARTNPAGAADDLDAVISEASDGNDAAFAAMQRQHGGIPLQPVVDRLKGLEERLNLQGRGVSADAVGRVHADLAKRYGATPDARLSAQQVRNMRNDMGTIVDPARTIKPNTRRDALTKVYAILNKEIEDVAENTRGVDVEALRTRNRHISTLIPVRDALKARAESEAERGIIAKAKAIPGNVVRRGARELDDLLGSASPSPAAAGVATSREDR